MSSRFARMMLVIIVAALTAFVSPQASFADIDVCEGPTAHITGATGVSTPNEGQRDVYVPGDLHQVAQLKTIVGGVNVRTQEMELRGTSNADGVTIDDWFVSTKDCDRAPVYSTSDPDVSFVFYQKGLLDNEDVARISADNHLYPAQLTLTFAASPHKVTLSKDFVPDLRAPGYSALVYTTRLSAEK